MAHADGTSARAHRLIALAAALLLAVTTALAFGRVFLGATPTLHLVGAAVAAACLAVAFERRSLLLATVVSGGRPRRRDRADRLPGDHLVRPPHRRHAPSGARRGRARRGAGEDPARARGADRSAAPGRVGLPLGRHLLGARAGVPRGEPAPRPRAPRGAGGLRRHGARRVRETALRRGVPRGRAPGRVRGRARPRAGVGTRLGIGSARGRGDRRPGRPPPRVHRAGRRADRAGDRPRVRIQGARRLRHARRGPRGDRPVRLRAGLADAVRSRRGAPRHGGATRLHPARDRSRVRRCRLAPERRHRRVRPSVSPGEFQLPDRGARRPDHREDRGRERPRCRTTSRRRRRSCRSTGLPGGRVRYDADTSTAFVDPPLRRRRRLHRHHVDAAGDGGGAPERRVLHDPRGWPIHVRSPTTCRTEIETLARDWTADADTVFDKVVAIEQRLRSSGEFEYRGRHVRSGRDRPRSSSS